MNAKIFWLKRPERPWGDYGDILVDGMSRHLNHLDGSIQLERTGPFVPPISFPGLNDVIVTSEFIKAVEASGLSGLGFKLVNKGRIVSLEWEKWDLNADEPFEYPEDGEPESYILEKPHSPEVASQIGDLWQFIPVEFEDFEAVRTDFWTIQGKGYTFVSEKAKDWIEQRMGEWVKCLEYNYQDGSADRLMDEFEAKKTDIESTY